MVEVDVELRVVAVVVPEVVVACLDFVELKVSCLANSVV
jgi:hypothetical protein